MFEYMKNNSIRMKNAFKSLGIKSYESFIYDYSYYVGEKITKQNRNGAGFTPEEAFHCSMFCHGVGAILREWSEGKYDISPEDAAQVLYKMLPSQCEIIGLYGIWIREI